MAGNRIGVVAEVGQVDMVTIPNPPANTNWTYTIVPNIIARPIAIGFEFNTDVNAATRRVRIFVDDGAQIYAVGVSGATQTAGLTMQYTATHNTDYSASSFNSYILIQLPDVFMVQGCVLRSNVAAFQAGDTFTNIRLVLQSYKGV
jgi:hypothetical protein